jgi:fumarate hydratase subunit alpha
MIRGRAAAEFDFAAPFFCPEQTITLERICFLVRNIHTSLITRAVAQLCIEANRVLPESLKERLECAHCAESGALAKGILTDLCENLQAADELKIPICQDTGMAVVFIELGQEVHLVGDDLEDAVNEGVHRGYVDGLLRCSVVRDPIRRGNTGDNTPAVLHVRVVPGDKLKLTVAPKGFGSENMSVIRMFLPSSSQQDIIDFVAQTARKAGSNPCPPMVLGVGIGGDFELCALLAKKALCRDVKTPNLDPYYAEMEQKCLQAVNNTGIGPQGFGGDTTALAVNIEQYPTHIAGLPVAVNVGCHVTRHKTAIL